MQRAVKEAAARAHLTKPGHLSRAPALLRQAGYDIRTIRQLPGHRDVSTTMIYTHVLNKGRRGVRRPLDELP